MQRRLLIARSRQLHVPVRLLDRNARRNRHGQFSLRPFHLQLFADLYLDAFGSGIGLFPTRDIEVKPFNPEMPRRPENIPA
jgi:hypothetical protein